LPSTPCAPPPPSGSHDPAADGRRLDDQRHLVVITHRHAHERQRALRWSPRQSRCPSRSRRTRPAHRAPSGMPRRERCGYRRRRLVVVLATGERLHGQGPRGRVARLVPRIGGAGARVPTAHGRPALGRRAHVPNRSGAHDVPRPATEDVDVALSARSVADCKDACVTRAIRTVRHGRVLAPASLGPHRHMWRKGPRLVAYTPAARLASSCCRDVIAGDA
jgi:hypothetical protein